MAEDTTTFIYIHEGGVSECKSVLSGVTFPATPKGANNALPGNHRKSPGLSASRRHPGALQKIAPLHKFLWQKDIALPPVILADFRTNAILFGIGGVIFWQIASLIMSLFLPMPQPQTWAQWLFGVIFFAVFFGCSAADYYRRQRRKFGLPSWQEIQNTP